MIFQIAGDICPWFDAFLAFFSCPQAIRKAFAIRFCLFELEARQSPKHK
jgi:hypothetical protein